MLEQIGKALHYGAFYTKNGVGQAGLTVSASVRKLSTGATIASGVTVDDGDGVYRYTLPSNLNDAPDVYLARFHTADGTVDCQDMVASYTVGADWVGDIDAPISGVLEAVTTLLHAPVVVVVAPINEDGDLELVRGADFLEVDGHAIHWRIDGNVPDLAGATITLELVQHSFPGVVLTASTLPREVYVELTAAQSALIELDHQPYTLKAALANTHLIPLTRGTLRMLPMP